jgi:predicted ATPase
VGARPEPAFVGRVEELQQLRGALDSGRNGGTGTTLVSGDAGVGKTSLVRRACRDTTGARLTLEGACLPLTSLTVPYQVLRSLVRDATDRGIDAPSGIFDETGSTSSVPVLFDGWLERLCERSPVVIR